MLWLILFGIFCVVGPLLNRWSTPDQGWGLILGTRNRIIAYYLMLVFFLAGVWGFTAGWLPMPWPIVLIVPAMLGWSLFLILSLGSEGLAKLMEPSFRWKSK